MTDYRLHEFSWTVGVAKRLAEAKAARDRLDARIAELQESLTDPVKQAPIGTQLKRRGSQEWYVVKYAENDWISNNGIYWQGDRILQQWECLEEVER